MTDLSDLFATSLRVAGGFQWSTDNEVTTDQTPATSDAGEMFLFTSGTAADKSLTLPSVGADEDGDFFWVANYSSYTITVTPSDSDIIGTGAAAADYLMPVKGSVACFRYDHSKTRWDIVNLSGADTITPATQDGRLTLTEGDAVPTADKTAATTLYFGSYIGDKIAMYNGSSWEEAEIYTYSEQSGDISSGVATITNLTDTTMLKVGQPIYSTTGGLPSGAEILTIDSTTQVTMNGNATSTGTKTIRFKTPLTSITKSFSNCVTVNGDATLTVPAETGSGGIDCRNLVVGMEITGTGIPGATTISSITSATELEMSNNASANGTVTITFKCPADNNYDVFAFLDAGDNQLRIALGPVWTDDTTRATALTQLDGVDVLRGSHSIGGTTYTVGKLKHLGAIRTTDTAGQSEDSEETRFLSNAQNKVPRQMLCQFGYNDNNAVTSASITANTNFAPINSGTNAYLKYLSLGNTSNWFAISCLAQSPANGNVLVGIGDNSTTSAAVASLAGSSENEVFNVILTNVKADGYYFSVGLVSNTSADTTGTIYYDTSRRGSSADPLVTALSGTIFA